jgi:phosphoribosylglycinamide formyltransferase 1
VSFFFSPGGHCAPVCAAAYNQPMAEPPAAPSYPFAVLISGSGSTLRNLLERCADGRLPARVCGVVASRECSGLNHAREFGVPSAIVARGQPFDAAEFAARVTETLSQWAPSLIVFGGFLSLYLPPPQWRGRVLNIHPALLPGFGGAGMYGDRVHEAVLGSGAKVTGCSVHVVDSEYDHGQVLAQRVVPVLPGDDAPRLGERVRAAERELLPEVIAWYATGRACVARDGTVHIAARDLRGG